MRQSKVIGHQGDRSVSGFKAADGYCLTSSMDIHQEGLAVRGDDRERTEIMSQEGRLSDQTKTCIMSDKEGETQLLVLTSGKKVWQAMLGHVGKDDEKGMKRSWHWEVRADDGMSGWQGSCGGKVWG